MGGSDGEERGGGRKLKDRQVLQRLRFTLFFKYASNTSEEDLQRLIGSDLVIQKAYEALNQFNWNEQELVRAGTGVNRNQ